MSAWISVADKMPPEGEEVLCVDEKGYRFIDWISGIESPEWAGDHYRSPVAWQYIPPAPAKGETSDD